MSTIQTQREQISSGSFESQVKEIARSVRTLLAEIAEASGIDISQPRGAARQLGIDKMLVWKLSKIATSSDPVAAMATFPGAAAQRTLLQAFARTGVPADLLARTQTAFEQFQLLVERHADDRETFEMMISSATDDGRQAREEAHRKLAFQGNSAIWGVHCRVRTCAYVVTPSSNPDFGDLSILGVFADVRRLRRDTRWTLATSATLDAAGRPVAGSSLRPLLPGQADFEGTPTIPRFCRGVLPPIERVFRPSGITHYELAGGEVGNTGVFTWAIGWRFPGVVPRWRSTEQPTNEFALNMLVPAEVAQLDLLVHREFWPDLRPTSEVCRLLPGESVVTQEGSERQVVQMHTSVERLTPDSLPVIHEVPEYTKMLNAAFASMGHNASDFAGFRVSVRFPILSTEICMHAALPEKPSA